MRFWNVNYLVELEGRLANPGVAVSRVLKRLQKVAPATVSAPRLSVARQLQRRLAGPDVAALVAEYRAGDDMKVLAERWRLHRTTVANHLGKAGVELRRQGLAGPELAEAVRLYGEGWSCERLGERFRCVAETVRQSLKRAGVRMREPWERI